jgi:hypothetical protein
MSFCPKPQNESGKREERAVERDRWGELTSAAASSIAVGCSCIIQLLAGPVLDIFAKREGWYEHSLYECKVSEIEGEDVASMGIETTSKRSYANRGNARCGKHERVKDNKSDAIWVIKSCLDRRDNNQFAGIEMLRMLGVVCEERKLEYMWGID